MKAPASITERCQHCAGYVHTDDLAPCDTCGHRVCDACSTGETTVECHHCLVDRGAVLARKLVA